MKKKVEDLKKGDKIKLVDKVGTIEEIELSDMGKQGIRKCRLVVNIGAEKIIIIRPSGYPMEVV